MIVVQNVQKGWEGELLMVGNGTRVVLNYGELGLMMVDSGWYLIVGNGWL